MHIKKILPIAVLSILTILLNTSVTHAAASVNVPPSVDFGNVVSGKQYLKYIDIRNTSDPPGSIQIKLGFERSIPDFESSPTPGTPIDISAGQTTKISVTFKSADPIGGKNNTLKIINSADSSVLATISLTGNTTPGNGGNTNGGSISMTFPNPIGEASTVTEVVKNVIQGIFGLLGAVAVIMIVYGGVMYMISGSSKDGAEKGKKIVTSAVIGLVIVLLSLAIVDLLFVLLGGR